MLAAPGVGITQFDAVGLRRAGQKLMVIHGTFSVAATLAAHNVTLSSP